VYVGIGEFGNEVPYLGNIIVLFLITGVVTTHEGSAIIPTEWLEMKNSPSGIMISMELTRTCFDIHVPAFVNLMPSRVAVKQCSGGRYVIPIVVTFPTNRIA
jgi:hypothetical protein